MDMKQMAKEKVLQQLIDMMDEKMTGDLKGKSPKFAKVDIQSDDPKLADELKDKLTGDMDDQEEKSETPEEMLKEKMDPSMEDKEQSPEDDSDMERLLDMYRKIK